MIYWAKTLRHELVSFQTTLDARMELKLTDNIILASLYKRGHDGRKRKAKLPENGFRGGILAAAFRPLVKVSCEEPKSRHKDWRHDVIR